MTGTLFTTSQLDKDGRKLVLDDRIIDVHYYDASNETWDKGGYGQQSWYNENFLATDIFRPDGIVPNKWNIVNSTGNEDSSVSQDNGLLVKVERAEGIAGISSEDKWRLTGDFDIRLYVDWDSYYNEYRSDSHTYLKVGSDSSNAVRVSFTFDSEKFIFDSEKTVNKNLKFFDWQNNGTVFAPETIDAAKDYLYLKITRQGGVLKCFIFNTNTNQDEQIGDDVLDAVFSQDLFVEIAVQTKEYNTVRSKYSKVIIDGEVTPETEFFSSLRGRRKEFPEVSIITVDKYSLSIIDEKEQTLWLRVLFFDEGSIPNSNTKIFACNGVVYCTTSDGLIAFDFPQDRIFKYKGSDIFAADEKIALRNAPLRFQVFIPAIGTIPNDNVHSVACKTIGSNDYIAFTHDLGVSVIQPLASGVASSGDGSLPSGEVFISGKNTLFWSGFDPITNAGELSYFSNIVSLVGQSSFNRSSFYDSETPLRIFGSNITSLSVLTVGNNDQLAVGTTEGITFIGLTPEGTAIESVSFGAPSAPNPFLDPSFEAYLAEYWKVEYSGFMELIAIQRSTEFSTDGETSIKFAWTSPLAGGILAAGTYGGIYQDVDLTGVDIIFFDIKMGAPVGPINMWDAQILVGDTVVKSYQDIEGPFTRLNDSVNVASFSGVQKFSVRITMKTDVTFSTIDVTRNFFIDNIKTKVGNPDFTILPPGLANIENVILQYDDEGHKIYFSTLAGFGALDIDLRIIDEFTPITTFVSGSELVSSDFSRIVDEF